jgi:hypothetical protein
MAAMEQLAADTGGEAIFNYNDLAAATSRAINNGSHYYTIVYTPANKKMDGQYRRIEVKLTEGKFKLAYRRGYYAEDASKAVTAPTLIAARQSGKNPAPSQEATGLRPLMARGMPSSSQILFGVRVLPMGTQPSAGAKRAGLNAKLSGPVTRYAADFLIDWMKVQLQTSAEGARTGMLHLELVAYDRDGAALNWTGQTMGLNFDAKTYAAIQKSGIPAHLEIDLPQTDVYLAVGIYDLQSGQAGTLEIPLDIRDRGKTLASVAPGMAN